MRSVIGTVVVVVMALGGVAGAANLTVTFDPGVDIFYNLSSDNPVLGTIINPNPFQVVVTTWSVDGTLVSISNGIGWSVPIIPASASYSGVVIDLMGCNICNPPLPLLGTYSGNVSFGWHEIVNGSGGRTFLQVIGYRPPPLTVPFGIASRRYFCAACASFVRSL